MAFRLPGAFPPPPAPENEHWLGPHTVVDTRRQAKSRTLNFVRYLYNTYVGPLDPERRLDCVCGFHGCINPFHHRPGRPNTSGNLMRRRDRAKMAEHLKAQANSLETQFKDLVEIHFADNDHQPVPFATLVENLWMVIHTDPKTGDRLPVSPEELFAFLARNPKLKDKVS